MMLLFLPRCLCTALACVLLQVALLALPERDGRSDGYLCREQEGELKYMAAFRDSARAVEWCLLVQVRAAPVICHMFAAIDTVARASAALGLAQVVPASAGEGGRQVARQSLRRFGSSA
jgi:hypothetical protein